MRDASRRFEERSYQNAEINAAYAKIEVSPLPLLHPIRVPDAFMSDLGRYHRGLRGATGGV